MSTCGNATLVVASFVGVATRVDVDLVYCSLVCFCSFANVRVDLNSFAKVVASHFVRVDFDRHDESGLTTLFLHLMFCVFHFAEFSSSSRVFVSFFGPHAAKSDEHCVVTLLRGANAQTLFRRPTTVKQVKITANQSTTVGFC